MSAIGDSSSRNIRVLDDYGGTEETNLIDALEEVTNWMDQKKANISEEELKNKIKLISKYLKNEIFSSKKNQQKFECFKERITEQNLKKVEEPLAKTFETFQKIIESQKIIPIEVDLTHSVNVILESSLLLSKNEVPEEKEQHTEVSEEPKKHESDNTSALALELAKFTKEQLINTLKYDKNDNVSPFTSAASHFIIDLVSDISPHFFEKVLITVNQKVFSVFEEKKEVQIVEPTSSLHEVKGLSEVDPKTIAPFLLLVNQSLLLCFSKFLDTSESKFSSLFNQLQLYLKFLLNSHGNLFIEQLIDFLEKIILESIKVNSKHLTREIPKEWNKASLQMSETLIVLLDDFVKKEKLAYSPSSQSVMDFGSQLLQGLVRKIGPKLFEEALFQLTDLIHTISIQSEQKLLTAKYDLDSKVKVFKMTNLAHLYFKDYFMKNPDPKLAPFSHLICQLMLNIIDHAGPKVCEMIIRRRPSDLTPEFKETIIHILKGVSSFLKNYATALEELQKKGKKRESITEEEILPFLLKSKPIQKGKLSVKDEDRLLIMRLLEPYFKDFELKIASENQILFSSFKKRIPDLILEFMDTILLSTTKIGFLHRLLESLKKKPSKKTDKKVDPLKEKKILQWSEEHKKFAHDLTVLVELIVGDIKRMINPCGVNKLIVSGGTFLLSMLKSKVSSEIMHEIYETIYEDSLLEKIEIIQNILWTTHNHTLVPTLSNLFIKTPEETKKEDSEIKTSLKDVLYQKISEGKVVLFEDSIKELCNQLGLEVYYIYKSEHILKVLIKEYIIPFAFLPKAQKLPPKTS